MSVDTDSSTRFEGRHEIEAVAGFQSLTLPERLGESKAVLAELCLCSSLSIEAQANTFRPS